MTSKEMTPKEITIDEFIQDHNYEDTITNILRLRKKFSGKYRIDETRAKEWVARQKSDLKQYAANLLIENTDYVDYNTFFEGIGELVDKVDAELKKEKYSAGAGGAGGGAPPERIYIYFGPKNKSFYFTAAIALYFMKQKNIVHPTHVLLGAAEFEKIVRDTEHNYPILIFDDCSYSGSQMSEWIANYYALNNDVNIILSIYGLNRHSLSRLVKLRKPHQLFLKEWTAIMNNHNMTPAQKNDAKKNYKEYWDSTISVLYVRLFDTMVEKVGLKDALIVKTYFGETSYNGGGVECNMNPMLSLYFDHKVADSVSTHFFALIYGPIIPNSFAPFQTSCFEYIEDYVKEQKPINRYFETLDITMSKEEINKVIMDVYKDILEKDVYDKNDNILEFYPFIKSCKLNDEILDFIREYNIYYDDLKSFIMNEYAGEGDDNYFYMAGESDPVLLGLKEKYGMPLPYYQIHDYGRIKYKNIDCELADNNRSNYKKIKEYKTCVNDIFQELKKYSCIKPIYKMPELYEKLSENRLNKIFVYDGPGAGAAAAARRTRGRARGRTRGRTYKKK